MANYYGQGRTNYFAVKDADAFKAEMAQYPVEVITSEKDGETLYGLLDADENGSGWPYAYITELEDEDGEPVETDMEIDWVAVFARHLVDGWVAVMTETGAEKYRYMIGYALAVNSKGESREVNLSKDIYTLAQELGDKIDI
jgi:hypothetical protein